MSLFASRLKPFIPQIELAAQRYNLDPNLIGAIVIQESSANPKAYRYEPKFYERYFKGIKRLLTATPRTDDDDWINYPKRVSASYGLMQLMYPTAMELGFQGAPEDLFDVDLNLDLGCKLIARNIKRANGSITAALLRYNGGGRIAYATEVLSKRDLVKASGVFA